MGEATLDEAIVATRIPQLSLVPSTVDLSGAELELIDVGRGAISASRTRWRNIPYTDHLPFPMC